MDITPFTPFEDKINLIIGGITALMTYLLGAHWRLFAFFIALNFGDYLTRWAAARINQNENSKAGWIGIWKKLCYWIMIALGFGMSVMFIEIGNVIGVDLSSTTFVGWFVLATLIVNEIRSILENLVDAKIKIPKILIAGLEVANNAIESQMGGDDTQDPNEEIKEDKTHVKNN